MRRIALTSLILLVACLAEDGPPRFEADESQPTTYRYRTPDGRWAFTGSLDQVPPVLRETAEPMDLSDVSLNTEIGNALAESAADEHRRLSTSTGCVAANIEAEQDTFSRILSHHQPTLGIAAIALALLFTAPMAVRYFGAPEWSRVLVFILPILGMLGALAFGIVEAREGLAHAREGAELCNPESFVRAPARERMDRLRQLDAFLAREGSMQSATD